MRSRAQGSAPPPPSTETLPSTPLSPRQDPPQGQGGGCRAQRAETEQRGLESTAAQALRWGNGAHTPGGAATTANDPPGLCPRLMGAEAQGLGDPRTPTSPHNRRPSRGHLPTGTSPGSEGCSTIPPHLEDVSPGDLGLPGSGPPTGASCPPQLCRTARFKSQSAITRVPPQHRDCPLRQPSSPKDKGTRCTTTPKLWPV